MKGLDLSRERAHFLPELFQGGFSKMDNNFFPAQNISLRDNMAGTGISVCDLGFVNLAMRYTSKQQYGNFSLDFCLADYLAGRILYEISR